MAVIAIPPLSVALPEMRDGLALLVVGTIFASFLIPAGILLFFFTRPSIWRSPLFIFNVCAIILGLVPIAGFWNLQLPTQIKVRLCFLMGWTLASGACSIGKTISLDELKEYGDYTYETVDLTIWSM